MESAIPAMWQRAKEEGHANIPKGVPSRPRGASPQWPLISDFGEVAQSSRTVPLLGTKCSNTAQEGRHSSPDTCLRKQLVVYRYLCEETHVCYLMCLEYLRSFEPVVWVRNLKF